MHGALGVERAHKADVVDALRQVRKERRDLAAALAVLLELPGALEQRRIALGELADDGAVARRQQLAVVFFSAGFGSKVSMWLGAPTMKRKMTDLALRREVRRLWRPADSRAAAAEAGGRAAMPARARQSRAPRVPERRGA